MNLLNESLTSAVDMGLYIITGGMKNMNNYALY